MSLFFTFQRHSQLSWAERLIVIGLAAEIVPLLVFSRLQCLGVTTAQDSSLLDGVTSLTQATKYLEETNS